MDVVQFFVWLAGVGAVSGASFILERIAWYVAQPSETKRWIFFGVAAFIGLVAQLINIFVPVEVLQQLAPYFTVLIYVFSYVFLGTAFHKVDKIS